MLSGESNAGERWKTTIGLIGKKSNFARATHLFCAFLYRCFARLQCETSTSYKFFGGNVVHVLVHLFFTAAHFHIGGRYLFPFCHHRYNIFMMFFQPKNISFLFFLSLALDLSLPFVRWTSLACLLISLFLCLSLSLYFKYVDMTINLS